MNSEPLFSPSYILSSPQKQHSHFWRAGWEETTRCPLYPCLWHRKVQWVRRGAEGARLPRKLAGDERGLSLGQILWGGDVVTGHQVLVWSCTGQLLILHLGFGHVVVSWVKVLLLRDKREVSVSEGLWSSSKARRLRSTINPTNLHPNSDLSSLFWLASCIHSLVLTIFTYAFFPVSSDFLTFVSSFPARVYIFAVKKYSSYSL